MLDREGQSLRGELTAVFARGADAPLPLAQFEQIARRIFEYQFRRNPPFAAYCRRRGVTPDSLERWTDIPPVPTAAFKEVRLACGPDERVEAVFRTSGTTRGAERRGEHHVLDLALYEQSLLPAFRAFVLPDAAQLPMLSLMPPAAELPDSSLAHMLDVVVRRVGAEGGGAFASVAAGLDEDRLARALGRARADGRPVCLLGTSLAFVHWLERLAAGGTRFELPDGSRLMDTGGFKGRHREVGAQELRSAYRDRLGIPAEQCVNEYGMTELGSQYYDTALRDRLAGAPPTPAGRKAGPPWLRARVVDPETLEPVPAGEVGILQHFDLANLGSVLAVQTEDLAREVDSGFLLLGRSPGAPPRGCSIAMDMMLEAQAEAGKGEGQGGRAD